MKPDDNWKETRLLAEDISQLLNIPRGVTEDYLSVVENLIIHKFIECTNGEDIRGQEVSIELPYLGSLIVSVDEKGHITTSFVVRNVFYRKLKNAYQKHESPLVSQLGDILGKALVERMEEGEIEDEPK